MNLNVINHLKIFWRFLFYRLYNENGYYFSDLIYLVIVKLSIIGVIVFIFNMFIK